MSKRLILAIFAAALLVASFSLAPSPAEAITGCLQSQSITNYYSDATYHTIVGWCISGCQGGCSCSGTITKYHTIDHLFCVDP
jgi:hypothetical protein